MTRSARVGQTDHARQHISLALSSLRGSLAPSCSSPLHSPPVAMVSWSDGESSEGSAAQYISSSDSPIKIPATIDDPLFDGVVDDLMVMCEHGNPEKKCVAFEGISTGRRFIACATEGANNCGLVEWVDEEWDHLQNTLHKLWLMYEDSQHTNRMACLEHSSNVHNLTQQKNEL